MEKPKGTPLSEAEQAYIDERNQSMANLTPLPTFGEPVTGDPEEAELMEVLGMTFRFVPIEDSTSDLE